MNYFRTYQKLIRRAKNRTIEGNEYTEKHHIFPISIFGKNGKIVKLTFREHYIAHLLLMKICVKRYGVSHAFSRKMCSAVHRMIYSSSRKKLIKSSRMLEIAKTTSRLARIGKPRPDMKGKSYFGADAETISRIRMKISSERSGKHINYPKNRKPLLNRTEEVFRKISDSRRKSVSKFARMSDDEFHKWVGSQDLYSHRADGSKFPNSNVTRVLIARDIPLSNYYKESDYSNQWMRNSKNRKKFYGL